MDLQVAGKVALVTGGSEGIGRAAAQRLANEGARVAIAARTQADLDRVAAEMTQSSGSEVLGIATDVRDEQAVKALVGASGREVGSARYSHQQCRHVLSCQIRENDRRATGR